MTGKKQVGFTRGKFFLFNLIGVIVIYGIPFLREIPIKGAEWLARVGSERKLYALTYVLSVFFVVPGLFAFMASG